MHRSFLAWIILPALAVNLPAAKAQGGREKAAVCAACHGADGNSANAEWPKLAAQHASYIRSQLAAFKSGSRQNALMSPMATGLSDEDMNLLGEFFASQKIQLGTAKKELLGAGQKIYRGGNAATGVPACMACHGPRGSGNPAAAYPALHGQHAVYTANQLKAYKNGDRTTDANSVMRTIAGRMSSAEIEAVASYLEGLH
ncbi:MAG: Cytochrome c4 [Gammaproteobacteria bacterium]|nr:Cytochrome c4 [Gammaproteobacteria bacterium]